MRDSARAPLYLNIPDRPYWVQYLPNRRTLYISYRADSRRIPTIRTTQFFARVSRDGRLASVRSIRARLRDNAGGNTFYNRRSFSASFAAPSSTSAEAFRHHLPQYVLRRDEPDLELERYTNVTFVGEPTGQRDAVLRRSRVSRASQQRDRRAAVDALVAVAVQSVGRATFHRTAKSPSISRPATTERGIDPALPRSSRSANEACRWPRLLRAASSRAISCARRRRSTSDTGPIPKIATSPAEPQMNALGYALMSETGWRRASSRSSSVRRHFHAPPTPSTVSAKRYERRESAPPRSGLPARTRGADARSSDGSAIEAEP